MNAGTELEVIEREMSSERLIMYAGATWDWHKLHYDQRYATEANLAAPIVDGQHFGGIFVEQALAAAEPSARVKAMKMRFRSMVFVGETIRVSGEVTSVEGTVVTMSQELKVNGRLCATAVTAVALP